MAVKKRSAITGLHSQGISDDIIKAVFKQAKKLGKPSVRKQIKKAYPVVKGTDRKVVKDMRKEQLQKIKNIPVGPKPPTKKQITPSMLKAQKEAKQKMYLNKLKGETKPRKPMTPAQYEKFKKGK